MVHPTNKVNAVKWSPCKFTGRTNKIKQQSPKRKQLAFLAKEVEMQTKSGKCMKAMKKQASKSTILIEELKN